MIRTTMLALAGGSLLVLGACNVRDPGSNQTETAAVTTNDGGVARETVVREEAPVTPAPAATAIQSQPGPDGAQVDLIKLAVTGDILTATFRCSSQETINSESFDIDDISLIDDATSQRISVLKDNAGKWLASSPTSDSIMTDCTVKPGIFWAKFPAPPATSRTVSINLPETAPFDGVPVTR